MGVIVWHAWPLTGRHVTFAPAHQLLRDDGSTGSLQSQDSSSRRVGSDTRGFATTSFARGLRILPGLWACLIVTAFVIAPIAVAIQGGSAAKLLLSRAPFEYVLGNSAVLLLKYDVAGTPRGIPWPGIGTVLSGPSIWEVLCYIAIAGLGVVGLLRRRWFIPAVLALVAVLVGATAAANFLR